MTALLRIAAVLLALGACSNPSSSPDTPAKQNGGAEATPPAVSTGLAADPREPALSQGIGHMLESEHLRHRAIDDAVSKEAFEEYLSRLDGGKMFLLADHAGQLNAYAELMDDQLRDGNLELARTGSALMVRRRALVAEMVADHLSRPFDLTRKERLETDPEKLAFAATEAELSERWRKMLKLQVLERIARMEEMAEALAKGETEPPDPDAADADPIPKSLQDIPDTFEGREKKAREELAKTYDGRFTRMADVEALEPVESFINAIATVYDPHTQYLPPADKENFDIQMSGQLEGIGAVLSEDDHYIVVREVVPGGASWRQGKLEAGDLILAVAQAGDDPVDVADMRIDKVVKMIRGPKGSVVTLTIKKPDDSIELLAITRDVVEIEAAYARGAVLDLGPKHPAMGYVLLPSFYGNTRAQRGNTAERNATEDVRTLLQIIAKRKVGGVIVDMRANGGGLLDHATDITGLFIETGPVVQTRFPDGKTQVHKDEDSRIAFDGEVVVLVDRFSASAAEIVAGALQDYRRALIVGTSPTHGKGTVQVLVDLDRMRGEAGDPLGVLKLTIQQFFRVDGDSTQWRGVVPDVTLPDPYAHIESGERYLDNAIPWSEIDPVEYEPWTKLSWDPDTLLARSKTRRTQQPVFAKIDAHSAYLKSRRDDTQVQLDLESWTARRERDKKALEAVNPKLDEGPNRFTIEVIDYDGKEPPVRGNGKSSDPLETWKKNLAHDPWVEEALHILGDMTATTR